MTFRIRENSVIVVPLISAGKKQAAIFTAREGFKVPRPDLRGYYLLPWTKSTHCETVPSLFRAGHTPDSHARSAPNALILCHPTHLPWFLLPHARYTDPGHFRLEVCR